MNIYDQSEGAVSTFATFLSDTRVPADQNGDSDTNASRSERYDRVLLKLFDDQPAGFRGAALAHLPERARLRFTRLHQPDGCCASGYWRFRREQHATHGCGSGFQDPCSPPPILQHFRRCSAARYFLAGNFNSSSLRQRRIKLHRASLHGSHRRRLGFVADKRRAIYFCGIQRFLVPATFLSRTVRAVVHSPARLMISPTFSRVRTVARPSPVWPPGGFRRSPHPS